MNETLNYNETVRASILDVSRVLFAKFGYKKTTMEDIAHELHKGKSSLYYYFKNKEEIFQAVIELEQNALLTNLKEVINSDQKAQAKLQDYVLTRMKTIIGLENYYKALTDERFGGGEFVIKVKESSEKEEEDMIKVILEEGIAEGSFMLKNVNMGAIAITLALKGIEHAMFTTSTNMENMIDQMQNVLNILFYGVIKR